MDKDTRYCVDCFKEIYCNRKIFTATTVHIFLWFHLEVIFISQPCVLMRPCFKTGCSCQVSWEELIGGVSHSRTPAFSSVPSYSSFFFFHYHPLKICGENVEGRVSQSTPLFPSSLPPGHLQMSPPPPCSLGKHVYLSGCRLLPFPHCLSCLSHHCLFSYSLIIINLPLFLLTIIILFFPLDHQPPHFHIHSSVYLHYPFFFLFFPPRTDSSLLRRLRGE